MRNRSTRRSAVHSNTPLWFMVSCLMLFSHCGKERFVTVGNNTTSNENICNQDTDCAENGSVLCVFGECVPVSSFSCQNNEIPLLHLQPADVDFGEVSIGQETSHTVTVTNAGTCNLDIFGVSLSNTSHRDFSCSPCDLTSYPQLLAPGRSLSVQVSYAPRGIGNAEGELLIGSSDTSVGINNIVKVPLHAQYSGSPQVHLDPSEVNFGYVPYSRTNPQQRTHTLRLSNTGSGNAALVVQFIYISPGSDITLPDSFANITPASPTYLAPYNPSDPNTWVDIPVTFAPTRYANQSATLTVRAHTGNPANAVNITARIAGSSVGPAVIQVTPTLLEFRTDTQQPLPVGASGFKQVAIRNTGESELTLQLSLDDASGDYTFSPSYLAPLTPGGSATVGVYYTPTDISDPAHPDAPIRSTDAFLRITSNDPTHVLTSVSLKGWAADAAHDDVLKLEMSFNNSDNSWAGNDFRDVDLELESPLGFSCRKPISTYAQAPNGTFTPVSTVDGCRDWNATGLEGHVAWVPGGLYEEPERVLLYGLGNRLSNNKIFTAHVQYAQDCSNMPSGLLASLLGIGTSSLLGILGSQVGVPLNINPSDITQLITQNCWEHSSTVATVRVFVNGREIASPQITLQRRGDLRQAIRIKRLNGSFTVEQP